MNTIQRSIQSRLNVTASEATLVGDVPVDNLSPKLQIALKQLDAVINRRGLERYRLLNGAAVAVQLKIRCTLVDKSKAAYSSSGLKMLSSASLLAVSGVMSSVRSPFVEAAWFVDYQDLEISLVCPLSHADILFSVL
jgi:hypothetical protein